MERFSIWPDGVLREMDIQSQYGRDRYTESVLIGNSGLTPLEEGLRNAKYNEDRLRRLSGMETKEEEIGRIMAKGFEPREPAYIILGSVRREGEEIEPVRLLEVPKPNLIKVGLQRLRDDIPD